MPELPEVETLRRQLEESLPGRRIVDCWISPDQPALVRRLNEESFVEAIVGRTITGVRRRAKWLLVDLDSGLVLVAHLRMTGRWLRRSVEAPEDPYIRARLVLDSRDELRWSDVRKFGTWDLVDDPASVIGENGPEPLEESFTPEVLLSAIGLRRAPIKAVLLDQRRVAGLGNIYVDEALWRSGIHPHRPAGSLTMTEVSRLQQAIVAVLQDSLDSGGSSMRDYLDSAGRKGRFQDQWNVYKREGAACRLCGSPIQKTKVSGRGTRYCPTCQGEFPVTPVSGAATVEPAI